MIHPSYVDLMKVVNKNVDTENGEAPVISSRYSIVMACAKRARQLVDGDEPKIDEQEAAGEKPLSVAVKELNEGAIRILAEDEPDEEPGELNLGLDEGKETLEELDEEAADLPESTETVEETAPEAEA